jgi:hypothetical protein
MAGLPALRRPITLRRRRVIRIASAIGTIRFVPDRRLIARLSIAWLARGGFVRRLF